MAMIGVGDASERSVATLNFALAAARDGLRVLMVDADHQAHLLTNLVGHSGKSEPSKVGWLSIGNKSVREIRAADGVSVLPIAHSDPADVAESIRKAVKQARLAGGMDLVVIDGPPMPLADGSRKLVELADALVTVLPTNIDINDVMERVLSALGDADRKLAGVILSELDPVMQTPQRGKQYA